MGHRSDGGDDPFCPSHAQRKFSLHELQIASLSGPRYQDAYMVRLREEAQELAIEVYDDPAFDHSHEGVSREEVVGWLSDIAMVMIEEELGTWEACAITPQEMEGQE